MPRSKALDQFRISMIRRARLTRGEHVHSVLLLDVGMRGVFVEWTDDPLPLGERVGISFRLPENERPIEAECRVAWWHPARTSPADLPAGAGLAFETLGEGDQARLQALIEEHTRRDPRARQFTRWWPDQQPGDER